MSEALLLPLSALRAGQFPAGITINPYTAEPPSGALQLGTGTGGGGNGAVSSQILPAAPPTFLSGSTLAGSDATHAVVAGNHVGLVGFYYVATGLAGNPSVPIISATFDGTNTTFVISSIGGNTNGVAFEVSLWPGGTTGQQRTGDHVATVWKPTAARTFWQLSQNLAFYQVDTYGTLYLIGLDGTGANLDFFRDLRVADLGCDAIENNGTYLALGNPQSNEPGPTIDGYLGYNGSSIKLFTDSTDNPRTKTFEAGGTPGLYAPFGNVGIYAAAASAANQTILSPKLRLVGTEWAGGIGPSTDRVAYLQDEPTDTAGTHELLIGFENRAAPTVTLLDGATADLQPYTDLGVDLGGISNRYHQVIAGATGFRVWNASGDANPIAELKAAGLSFGAGGAAAVDTSWNRLAAGTIGWNDLALQLGGVSNRLLQLIGGPQGFRVWNASGDANPIAELKAAGLSFGAGGAAAVDSLVKRYAAGVMGTDASTMWQVGKGITLGNGLATAPDLSWDGTNVFLENTGGGPIFFRPNAGNNNNAFIGNGTGSWSTRDGAGVTRSVLDDGTGMMQVIAGKGLDTGGAGTLLIGSANATTVQLTPKTAGNVDFHYATTALGGGAGATLGTIGGAGPAAAAQNSWLAILINGTASFIPIWR